MGESKRVTNETGDTEEVKDKAEESVRVGTIWDARSVEDEDDDDENDEARSEA